VNLFQVQSKPLVARRVPFEPRFNPRASLRVELTMLANEEAPRAFVENVSEGGAFVATEAFQAIGARILIEFRLENAPVRVLCEVRWRRTQENPFEGPAGMGLLFLDLKDDDALRIREAVEMREPMFWE